MNIKTTAGLVLLALVMVSVAGAALLGPILAMVGLGLATLALPLVVMLLPVAVLLLLFAVVSPRRESAPASPAADGDARVLGAPLGDSAIGSA
jgi:hypothetical protein